MMEKIPGDELNGAEPQENPKKKMIKRICSWCGADMGFTEGAEGDGEVTHGICEKCNKAFREKHGIKSE